MGYVCMYPLMNFLIISTLIVKPFLKSKCGFKNQLFAFYHSVMCFFFVSTKLIVTNLGIWLEVKICCKLRKFNWRKKRFKKIIVSSSLQLIIIYLITYL